MDHRFLANQLLAAFGKTLTLDGLAFGDDDTCVLLFDDDLAVTIEFDAPETRLVFSVFLDKLPEIGVEPLLRELMAANLYWLGTGGATIGLQASTGALMLVIASPVTALDDAGFERVIDESLRVSLRLRARIVAHKSGHATAKDATISTKESEIPPIYG
jgi:Tir chaperone protein (CesT) family